MESLIQQRLFETGQLERVKILYACETGSRAWGFPSADSDYDVRFIYTRRISDYLSITDKNENIALPVTDRMDIGGWDFRKTLQLFLQSSAPLYEWLQSPIFYMGDRTFVEELRTLMPKYFSCRTGSQYYISTAHNVFEGELQAREVRLKKYFHALRPALAALWTVEKQTIPPMEFSALRDMVADTNWQRVVDELLLQRTKAGGKTMVNAVPLLHDWLKTTLAYCAAQSAQLPELQHTTAELDTLFRNYIAA
ncbi:nucleotidyltransferase domain-containing protein [Chitinophaga horti]|uniref:Nucleotidyltransferase domain-containing protein n=1 Tax=Chitinophaga horti TaxID=2920382 RepID=A0ABY6IZM0_9BACT|nr:nucleotidyltransferase domain-containing protein [Chitinophaga horti]UYQ92626.1 nucleotidyltransferase domain-containing protein [Chitinophaga horti]